jgi:hypothetical protein
VCKEDHRLVHAQRDHSCSVGQSDGTSAEARCIYSVCDGSDNRASSYWWCRHKDLRTSWRLFGDRWRLRRIGANYWRERQHIGKNRRNVLCN